MANEMRDRLVELIFQGDEKCSEQDCRDCKYHGKEFCGFEHIADHLIKNGVYLLPEDLKGTDDFSISAFIEAMQMYKEKDQYVKLPYIKEYGCLEPIYEVLEWDKFDGFIVTQHNTKEEAEQKLKEMRCE